MVLGITGSFCSGKSLVAKIFKKYGAKIIDLDKLAHQYLKLNTPTAKKIIKLFGKDIIKNGAINRRRLGQKAFGDNCQIQKLSRIIHPRVCKDMLSQINKSKKKCNLVVVEAPLLFEANLAKYFDYIIVVKARRDVQIRRAESKFRLERNQITRRINCQLPLSKKIRQADFIIDNNQTINETTKQVEKILKQLNRRRKW